MQAILIYGLKACIYSGVFFLYYHISLRNKRFHYYNRFYLLMAVAASLLLPFLNIELWQLHSSDKQVINILNFVQVNSGSVIIKHADSYFSAENIIAFFYVCIALCLLLLLIFSIIKIFKFRRRFPVEKLDEINFITTDLDQAPFSFFNNLFWKNTIEISSDIGKQIFRHELTHIEQKHSVDKLFMRIVTAVFFVNPFYWLMQKELFLLHEFIADDKAIANKSAEAFARMLLQSQYGKTIFSPAQSFNYSPIKRRLLMLTTSKKPRFSYARRIMILPLAAVLILLFSFRLKKENYANSNNIYYKEKVAQQNSSDTAANSPIYVLDGKVITAEAMKAIDTHTIESINILKGEDAIKLYGEKGKNGVVVITLKKPNSSPTTQIKSTDTVAINAAEKSLKVVDGKIISTAEMKKIDVNSIESISILKGSDAVNKYGDKGTSGVIEITTKNAANNKQPASFFTPPVIEKDKVDTSDNKEKYESVFTAAQTPPSFPGGKEEWLKYLQRNLNANILTDKKAPTGTYTALVSFTVDADDNLSDFKAEKDPGFGTGAEAMRVIQREPKWIPAKQNGQAVTAIAKQAITFAVEDSK